jgi:malyl-CoA/(S)-citramalyl-CoA lyase
LRSLLAVPANNARFVAKAAQSEADAVFLDLEDAVVPELKEAAREAAIEAIATTGWGERLVAVRVNGLATPWGSRDLEELAARCTRLDRVILPKCETAADVAAADALLGGSEVRLDLLIESAKGVANVEAIAAAHPRVASLVFGSGDYSLDMGLLGVPGDFSFALARIANAARANGLAPIDGPYFETADPEGMRASCGRALSLGYEGKMCIHPSQVAIANAAFSPSESQLAWAREVLDAMAAAGEMGRGAVKTRDGKMIDLVHIKIARKVIERVEGTPTKES